MRKLIVALTTISLLITPLCGQQLNPATGSQFRQQAQSQVQTQLTQQVQAQAQPANDTEFKRLVRQNVRRSNLGPFQKLRILVGMRLYGDFIEEQIKISYALQGKVTSDGQIDWDEIDWEELLRLILEIIKIIVDLFGEGTAGGPPDIIISGDSFIPVPPPASSPGIPGVVIPNKIVIRQPAVVQTPVKPRVIRKRVVVEQPPIVVHEPPIIRHTPSTTGIVIDPPMVQQGTI